MSEPTQSGIDYDGLLHRVEGDEAFARELLGLFLFDVPLKLDSLMAAIGASDAVKVEKLAHSLKGTSATVKAVQFEPIAFALEMASKNGETDRWAELGRQLQREFDVIAKQAAARGITPRSP